MEPVSQSEAVAMMLERGIDNPDQLLSFASTERIAGACRWWDTRPSAGPGVLARAIRNGGMQPRSRRSVVDEQAAYGQEIVAWLTEHLPGLCHPNPKLVSLQRELYGDTFADKLAASTSPHPAAIAAVIRLHATEGRRLSASRHGPMIREVVRECDRVAIAESQELLSKQAHEHGGKG